MCKRLPPWGIAPNLAALHKSWWMMKLVLVRGDAWTDGWMGCALTEGGDEVVNCFVTPYGIGSGLVTR